MAIPGAKTPLGQVYIIAAAPAAADPRLAGFTLKANGAVCADTTSGATPSVEHGFKFNAAGQLITSAGPAVVWQGGLPFDAAGALVTSASAPLATDPYVGEVRVGAAGVYVTTATPPGPVGFDLGFDGGFDAD